LEKLQDRDEHSQGSWAQPSCSQRSSAWSASFARKVRACGLSGVGVRGLTTAASIWLTTAVGMACGAGLTILALATTIARFIIILGFPHLQLRLPKRVVHVETRVTPPEGE
jgi:hypothetical protein